MVAGGGVVHRTCMQVLASCTLQACCCTRQRLTLPANHKRRSLRRRRSSRPKEKRQEKKRGSIDDTELAVGPVIRRQGTPVIPFPLHPTSTTTYRSRQGGLGEWRKKKKELPSVEECNVLHTVGWLGRRQQSLSYPS